MSVFGIPRSLPTSLSAWRCSSSDVDLGVKDGRQGLDRVMVEVVLRRKCKEGVKRLMWLLKVCVGEVSKWIVAGNLARRVDVQEGCG